MLPFIKMASREPSLRIFQKALRPLHHIARPSSIPLSHTSFIKNQSRKATIASEPMLPSTLQLLKPTLFRELLASNHSTKQTLPLITPLGKAHILPVGWVNTGVIADVVKCIEDNALEGMEKATMRVFRVGYDDSEIVETKICVSVECNLVSSPLGKVFCRDGG